MSNEIKISSWHDTTLDILSLIKWFLLPIGLFILLFDNHERWNFGLPVVLFGLLLWFIQGLIKLDKKIIKNQQIDAEQRIKDKEVEQKQGDDLTEQIKAAEQHIKEIKQEVEQEQGSNILDQIRYTQARIKREHARIKHLLDGLEENSEESVDFINKIVETILEKNTHLKPSKKEDNFNIPKREECKIENEDYKRENSKDREFRKKYTLKLLEHFKNRCAICGCQDNGLDLDHYFIAKSYGGNFILKTNDGQQILNCVPLCESCNRSKQDKEPSHNEEILLKIKTFNL